jgi:hypothetical protein
LFVVFTKRRGLLGIVQNLRHWFDARGVNFVELVDMYENVIQFRGQPVDLRIRKTEIGEPGDVPDFALSYLHAVALLREFR